MPTALVMINMMGVLVWINTLTTGVFVHILNVKTLSNVLVHEVQGHANDKEENIRGRATTEPSGSAFAALAVM